MKDTEIIVAGKCVGEYDMCPDDNRPDWEQNERQEPNYIKNRPGYRMRLDAVCTKTPIDVISAKRGDIFRMDEDVNSYGGNRFYIGYINFFLTDFAPIYMSRIRQEFFNTDIKYNYVAYWNLNNTCIVEDIGTGGNSVTKSNKRCDISYEGSKLFCIYLIANPSYLYDSYKSKFTKNGIYLEFLKMPKAVAQYCKLTFEAYYYHQFDASYIPRQAFLVPEPASYNKNMILTTDADGKIKWDTDVPVPYAVALGSIAKLDADGNQTDNLDKLVPYVSKSSIITYRSYDGRYITLLPHDDVFMGTGYNRYNGIAFISTPAVPMQPCRYGITIGMDPTSVTFTPIDFVPAATSDDAGKVLMIGSDGKPAWTTLPTSTSTDTNETT